MIYTVSPDWSKSIQLATYICDVAFDSYKLHLPCYNQIVSSSYPSLCKLVFDRYPARHEMYAAKCQPNDTESQAALQLREKLIACYLFDIEKECGVEAREVISPPLRMHYSFDYLPPCQLPTLISPSDRRNRTTTTVASTPLGARFRTTGYSDVGFGPPSQEGGLGNPHNPAVMGDGAAGAQETGKGGGSGVATGSLKMTPQPDVVCACPVLPVKNSGAFRTDVRQRALTGLLVLVVLLIHRLDVSSIISSQLQSRLYITVYMYFR